MSKINLKTDYEDGQILHGDELNVNNNVAMIGVNDNFDRITNLGSTKADVTYVDNQIATRASYSDLNTGLRNLDLIKADKTELANKADQTEVDTKASITYVDNSVAPKANKSYVDAQLNTKANEDDVNTALALKANKTYVDTQLNTKANSDTVTSALALKEDKTTIGNLSDLTTDVKTSIVAAINSIDVEASPIATTSTPGIVKPDGETITVDQDGTIHASSGGGGGGTTDYTLLSNKPQINSVELNGNKSLSDLGLMSSTAINTALDLKADKSTTYTKTQIDTTVSGLSDDISAKADKSTTYTKTQVDTAISTAVADKADTSTVNTALEGKADKSTTYTKTQVDSAITASEAGTDAKLLLKANTADVYTKSEVDTKDAAKADNLSFSNNMLQPKSGSTLIGDAVEIEVATNDVVISQTQPQDDDWKLWIDSGQVNNLGSEVVDSLVGNETNFAPSVRAVKENLIESGSNSDGTMICYGRIYDDVSFNTQYGSNVYYNTKSLTFPQTFIDTPTINLTMLNATDLISASVSSISSTSVSAYVYSLKQITGAIAVRFNYIAIGKWK